MSPRGQLSLLLVLVGSGMSCSNEPSGTLTIQLDPYSGVTRASTVTVAGTVTRTPPKDTRIVVRATGGLGAPADTVEASRFSFPITLNPNATNQVSLTATDEGGSTSPSVSVSVRHDATPPTIAQATPADASADISVSPSIQLRLSETSVVGVGGGIRLTRQGVVIPGTSTISADSLTLTFALAGSLMPNAIYRVGLSGVTDAAGNVMPASASACFVTTATGAASLSTATDPTADTIRTIPSPTQAFPDLVAARFSREPSSFAAVFQFIGPRVFSSTAQNQAGVIVDLDIDQDSTTGFTTYKDTLFRVSGSPALMAAWSGIRAEYVIDIEPFTSFGDSAFVGRYTAFLEPEISRLFVPGVCGPYMSVVVPWAELGNDDGIMNVLLTGIIETAPPSGTGALLYLDPMPFTGNIALNLSPTGPSATWASAPSPVKVSRPFRRVLRPLPLR